MSDQVEAQGPVGVGLFVAAYVDEREADETLETLKEARGSGEFFFDDAAVVRRDANGNVHIDETGDMSSPARARGLAP